MDKVILDVLSSFFRDHFDTMLTVSVTIIGFIVTYFMTRRNFKNEVIKSKIAINTDVIKDLPFEIAEMMNRIQHKNGEEALTVKDYSDIMTKILAYGSKDAVAIATHMQQSSFILAKNESKEINLKIMALYSLLITQIKFDISSEIISPENWFLMKITDYSTIQPQIKQTINKVVDELNLNKSFKV